MILGAMKKACKISGINDGRERSDVFSFHSLRHQAVTEWHRDGIPPKVAMLSMGDKSAAMLDRYISINDDDVTRTFRSRKKFYQSFIRQQKAQSGGDEK